MKFTFSLEGDFYEDGSELFNAVSFLDTKIKIDNLKEAIRSRRKHHEISSDEDKFLSSLHEILYEQRYD